jgi:phytol kinase
MPPLTDFLLIPVSVGALLGVMLLVRWAAPRLHLTLELQRKLVHVSTGLYALTLPFTFRTSSAVLLLIVMSLAVLAALRLPVFARGGLAAAVHAVERKSFGEIYLALAVGFTFWLSGSNLVLYALPILVLTLSDAAAALAGTRYGSRHFAVEAGTKSWEGVAMFFMVTLIISMVLLLLMTEIGRLNVIVLSVLIAAFGALVEADSWGGLDNLFVPVGVHLMLASHLETPPAQLALLASVFVLTMFFLVNWAEKLGIRAHSARAYVVLLFLICAVTAPYNAVLPAFAVLTHVAARALNPCRSTYPDLDIIAVSAAVALFWLFAGEYFGRNALNVYNLTFAAMAVLLTALATRPAQPVVRMAAAGAVVLLVSWLLAVITPLNEVSTRWHGPIWLWIAASLSIAMVAGLTKPEAFARYRALRVMAVAAPAPLLLFIIKGLAA